MAGTQYVTPLTDALEREGIAFELLEHATTMTAVAEAVSLGLRPEDVAKTIVVTGPSGNTRVVVLASERIDMHKLRDLLEGGKDIHLLTEEELASEYPQFELGAVPPVGGPADAIVVDQRVSERESIVLEAGAHDHSVRLAPGELARLGGARVADVCGD